MNDKLKACPFCGGEDLIIETLSSRTDILTNYHACIVDIRCNNCHTLKSATVYGVDENDCMKEVIRLWNRRVNENEDNNL